MSEMGASDADPKSVNLLSSFTPILEDTEGCNDRAIKRLKKQLKDATMSTAVASWKITIYAGGLSPGVVEPQNLFSSVGVNVGRQSWADFDKGCDRHVTKSFANFLASMFCDFQFSSFKEFFIHCDSPPALDTCHGFQNKMAEFLPKNATTKKRFGIDVDIYEMEKSVRRLYGYNKSTGNGALDIILPLACELKFILEKQAIPQEKTMPTVHQIYSLSIYLLILNSVKTSSTGIASLPRTLRWTPLWTPKSLLKPDMAPHESISYDSHIDVPRSPSFQPYSGDATDGWALLNLTWDYRSMNPNYMESADSLSLNTQQFDMGAELEGLIHPEWLLQFSQKDIELVSQSSAVAVALSNPFSNPEFCEQYSSSSQPPDTWAHIVPPRAPHQYSPAATNEEAPHALPFETDERVGFDIDGDEATGGGGVTEGVRVRVGIVPCPRPLRASKQRDDPLSHALKAKKELKWLHDSLSHLRSFDLGKSYEQCVTIWYELEVSLPAQTKQGE
ncbi:hypothetical protein F5146DRAFT_1144628 [Armillaria mellea]|nr:hypothetical protein F5146DRAFT_1144628 [Armillaria mellea]